MVNPGSIPGQGAINRGGMNGYKWERERLVAKFERPPVISPGEVLRHHAVYRFSGLNRFEHSAEQKARSLLNREKILIHDAEGRNCLPPRLNR